MRPVVLAVLVSAACPAGAEWGAPRLRVEELEGELRVTVADSLTYRQRGPVSADELEFWPGTVIEVTAGRAVFESDVRARIVASAGSAFRISMTEDRGLRVASIPGTLPVSVEVGGFVLAVWGGGVLAVHDGGRIDVENAGVYRVPGGLDGAGEALAATLAETGISLTPGDSLSLDLAPGRGFPAGPAGGPWLASTRPDLRDALSPAPSVARAPGRPASGSGGPPRGERWALGQTQALGVAVLALALAAIVGRNLL